MLNGVWMKCHRSLLQVATPCFHHPPRVEAQRRCLRPVWVCVALWQNEWREMWAPSVCCSADKGTLSPQHRSWAHHGRLQASGRFIFKLLRRWSCAPTDTTPESRSLLPFTHPNHKTTFSLLYFISCQKWLSQIQVVMFGPTPVAVFPSKCQARVKRTFQMSQKHF